MVILLQKEERNKKRNVLSIEKAILTENIRGRRQYEVMPMYLYEFYDSSRYLDTRLCEKDNFPKYYADAVPVGTVQFITAWMQIFHGHGLNPVEVPEILRKPPYVCREYRITSSEKIPRTGKWFVKDVSQPKTFSTGLVEDMEKIDFDLLMDSSYRPADEFSLGRIDKDHLFLASEFLRIKAEYRAYFIKGELCSLCLYNGDFAYTPDVGLINAADMEYRTQKDYPVSYTMDVMVMEDGHTELLEIHPFAAVGLYSTLWPDSLPEAYKDGINYYIRHNTAVRKWEKK